LQRIKQVVHHATKLNEVFAAARGVPLSRAHITYGGHYDGVWAIDETFGCYNESTSYVHNLLLWFYHTPSGLIYKKKLSFYIHYKIDVSK
jgi:hypothetical protein